MCDKMITDNVKKESFGFFGYPVDNRLSLYAYG